MTEKPRQAIIIGAGPAGLTAAYELVSRTDIIPVVLEKSDCIGGLSRTVNHHGNRMDIGGHRFFSKSDRVMNWWLSHMPVESEGGTDTLRMLLRTRKSRIYFLRKFFDYPIRLNRQTLANLGFARVLKIAVSYGKAVLLPPRHIENLEQFFISRFGGELYRTFFKSYTEKVWGIQCENIPADWGAQRVKGVSILKSLAHSIRRLTNRQEDFAQKDTETSLIEKFLYPKYGPGQMWDAVAAKIREAGGEIITGCEVRRIHCDAHRVTAVTTQRTTGEEQRFEGEFFFSTMPVKELARAMTTQVPRDVLEVTDNLCYRDFITVGVLLRNLKLRDPGNQPITDNWVYVQEPEVLAGRLQVFNNWSPHLVADPGKTWIGVEYFCFEGDSLWASTESEISALAIHELESIGVIDAADVLDATVIRVPRAYPAYFGAYKHFPRVRCYFNAFENLFLIGRNGMHRYNNQDHSMLTAMQAVDNIVAGRLDKSNVWDVNTELEYHEERATGAH